MTATPIVAVIDYGSGNLRSAEKALARAARDSGTAHEVIVTADPDEVVRAERIVLPGVGAFGDCMRGLTSIGGMVAALEDAVLKRGVPFLGICVGMQLLASVGREHGEHKGLGWIDGEVVRIAPRDAALKIPHMGWNELRVQHAHSLLDGMGEGPEKHPEMYFVHSYEFRTRDRAHTLAVTDYGGAIAAVVGRDNIAGVQFHPEKSQAAGLALLARFLKWQP
jgi:glutamine amidotransferase